MKPVFIVVFMFTVLLVHDSQCFKITDVVDKAKDVVDKTKDVGRSIKDTGKGIAKKIPDVIPSADTLLLLGKNAVAGYPFDLAFKAINTLCKYFRFFKKTSLFFICVLFILFSIIKTGSASLSSGTVQPRFTPDLSSMNFVLKFDHKDYLIPLTQPELLWKHEKFNPTWPTVLLATGWTTNYNESIIKNSALDTLYEAYHCRGNINFVVRLSTVFLTHSTTICREII